MFLPPIRSSFPLLPGFSFGEKPTSYPVRNDFHVSKMVLGIKTYEKRGDASEYTTISSNLIVLFRVLAFYIDLQALPGFWENIAQGWKVTNVENTRSIVNFYADRHLDWARSPGMGTKNMSWRDKLLIHLVGYWCEHRDKTIRRSGPDDLRLFRDMGIEWSYLRDVRRKALFSDMGDASLRGLARNVPELTISYSLSTQRGKTSARRVGQSQEFNRTWQSPTDPRTESKSSQSFERGYTEQRNPRHRSRSFSVPRGAQPLDASFRESQRSRLPSGVVNEPVTSQPSETSQMMAGGHQHQHEGYISSQPFQVNPSQLGVSQSLDSSCPQSQELPAIAKSVAPAKDIKDTIPKPSAKKPQPKKQVPLSPKRIQKALTSSPSPSTGSDGDFDSEESESESESETEASSVYQDTGSGAEPGAIQRFKRDHIPRKMTRSLTTSPSGNSSSSGDSSDYDSASDSKDEVDENNHGRFSDSVGESSSGSDSDSDSNDDSVSDDISGTSSNTDGGSSANDSESSDDDSDGSEDESDSEPEPPKPLTPKKSVKKPAKTPLGASTRGKKKARPSNDTKEEEDRIKSEPDSDSGIASVPMASIPSKDQEPPTSAQRPSVPPTKRRGQPKPEIRPAKRRREEDEAEKQTTSGRPAAKKRATAQQQSSPSEKKKSSKARRRVKKPPAEASYGEEPAKARRYAQKKSSSPRPKQTFKDLSPIGSEHKRSIDMLIQRINALEEKSMTQDKKIMKQDEKIMKQDKKIIRQDEKMIRQDEKIIKQDEKMMK